MQKHEIEELMKYFSELDNVARFKLKYENIQLELEKEITPKIDAQIPKAPVMQNAPIINEQITKPESLKSLANTIKAPMVGTFYQASAPGAKPFVKVGDVVSKGQPVAIIEAMKIMNEIEAEYDCKIVKFLIEDGQAVEYDMPLFEVEKL